jgi:dTDP-4-amino-4,6-dideoxygalactose transaminase
MSGLSVINIPTGNRCSYYKYPLIINGEIKKETFVQTLNKHGIETGTIFYPPCHMQPLYKKQLDSSQMLHVSEKVLENTIALPMHSALNDLEVLDVIENVRLATYE